MVRRVSEYIKQRCLAGLPDPFAAYDAGLSIDEMVRCFRAALMAAQVLLPARLAYRVLKRLVERGAGLGSAYGVPVIGADIDAFIARYVDNERRVITAWDYFDVPFIAFEEDVELKRDLHMSFEVTDHGVLRYLYPEEQRVVVELRCWKVVEPARMTMESMVVEWLEFPRDAAAVRPAFYFSGVMCAGAWETPNRLYVGVGYAVGDMVLDSEPAARGQGIWLWLNDADGYAERFCVHGFCVTKDPERPGYVWNVVTDDWRAVAYWYRERETVTGD